MPSIGLSAFLTVFSPYFTADRPFRYIVRIGSARLKWINRGISIPGVAVPVKKSQMSGNQTKALRSERRSTDRLIVPSLFMNAGALMQRKDSTRLENTLKRAMLCGWTPAAMSDGLS